MHNSYSVFIVMFINKDMMLNCNIEQLQCRYGRNYILDFMLSYLSLLLRCGVDSWAYFSPAFSLEDNC